jgi:hypothetical protein
MSLKRKVAGSVLLCALMAAIVGMAITFSSFTATTVNDGNHFKAGTVVIGDNAAGSTLISMDEMSPNSTATATRCLTVDYTGSLPADVSMYAATSTTTAESLGKYLDVTIKRGTFAAGFTPASRFDCGVDGTDFLPAKTVYTGLLQDLPATFAAGLEPGAAPWIKDDSNVYQVTVALHDTNAAQGLDATTKLTFEAQDAHPAS